MSERRRVPGVGAIIAVLFLVAPLAGVVWWVSRPKGESTAPGPALAELDVVCTGRVDGRAPVAGLDPPIPGKVAEVFVTEGQTVAAGKPLLRLEDDAIKLHAE